MPAAERHEVDQQSGAFRRDKARLQDQAVTAIASGDPGLVAGRDDPAPLLVITDERREAGVRIEPRPAQPIDRAVTPHERRRFAVADQRIVFNAQRHSGLLQKIEDELMSLMSSGWRSSVSTKRPRGTRWVSPITLAARACCRGARTEAHLAILLPCAFSSTR